MNREEAYKEWEKKTIEELNNRPGNTFAERDKKSERCETFDLAEEFCRSALGFGWDARDKTVQGLLEKIRVYDELDKLRLESDDKQVEELREKLKSKVDECSGDSYGCGEWRGLLDSIEIVNEVLGSQDSKAKQHYKDEKHNKNELFFGSQGAKGCLRGESASSHSEAGRYRNSAVEGLGQDNTETSMSGMGNQSDFEDWKTKYPAVAALANRIDEKGMRVVYDDSEWVTCSYCGKPVSTRVPKGTVVRAWVECGDCIELLSQKEKTENIKKIIELAKDFECCPYCGSVDRGARHHYCEDCGQRVATTDSAFWFAEYLEKKYKIDKDKVVAVVGKSGNGMSSIGVNMGYNLDTAVKSVEGNSCKSQSETEPVDTVPSRKKASRSKQGSSIDTKAEGWQPGNMETTEETTRTNCPFEQDCKSYEYTPKGCLLFNDEECLLRYMDTLDEREGLEE